MPLINDVNGICTRLAPLGWGTLLLKHGLDITNADLAAELVRPLPAIDRSVPGFEDFASEGMRGIEEGDPARSLLYHAMASPNVLAVDGVPLGGFPTLREIEIIENYAFGIRPPTLQELTGISAGSLLAVVVFATDYRPGVDTVHRKHADLCFSRTGVARVGTAGPLYEAQDRGFLPQVAGDDHAFRVLPSRYSAWIAVQKTGDAATFGPMRFDFRKQLPDFYPDPGSDGLRNFWVPLHKLFSGPECIHGFDLSVGLTAHHVNEKIRRIHMEMARRGANSGWNFPDIDQPPFRFTDGIAEFSNDPDYCQGLLTPVTHPALVEAAQFNGVALTFSVPPEGSIQSRTDFLPTFEITAGGVPRLAPEYVHARTVPDDPHPDLNDLPDPAARVGQGNYRAQHYIDFTGDGWIEADCPQIRPQLPRFIAAYSLVTAPDFFFNCDQREVMDWWLQKAPQALRDFIWVRPPLTLADERIPPNLKLNNVDFHAGDSSLPIAGFRQEDDTPTAIVSLLRGSQIQDRPLVDPQRNRHNPLPDGAAGIFAPGWDTSRSITNNVEHLASYGLGSPFPEDSKLCAALGTFWPAVAPDAGRSFSHVFSTVSPLTDEEIGSVGNLPWDGVPGPRLVQAGAVQVVEYADFDHVDYVLNAAANRFSLSLTSNLGTREYVARLLAMAKAYEAVGISVNQPRDKTKWNVLSFRKAAAADPDLAAAQAATGQQLNGEIFRFEMFKPVHITAQPADPRKQHTGMSDRRILLIGGDSFLVMKQGGTWHIVHV